MMALDIILLIVFLLCFMFVLFFFLLRRKKPAAPVIVPEYLKPLLQENVLFYQKLNDEEKERFAQRVQRFLQKVNITGVGTTVEDLDSALIGASAVIPIFAFPDWRYTNIKGVLLYPDTFNEEFETEGVNRSTLGMVGNGAMQQMMLLSQHALREGFSNKTDKNNTAIHEFVHLIDKTDGAVDGVPELLLQHQYSIPWINLMHQNIKAIEQNKSDINPYGATNQAEFFAVVSEYFFERPQLLKSKHPALYDMLEKMFDSPEE